jgi:hypothetical protein
MSLKFAGYSTRNTFLLYESELSLKEVLKGASRICKFIVSFQVRHEATGSGIYRVLCCTISGWGN